MKSYKYRDISLYCASIDHGVDSIDQDSDYRDYDWYSGEGRWWMGLFTNDSNVKNRNTSVSLDTYHAEKFLLKNKTILITSGNSLVGNELINFLIKEKFKVIALYRNNFKKIHPYLIQIKHDFSKQFIRNKKIDVLVNCIATHEFSKKTIHDYSSSNVLSVINIIDYVKKQKISLVINLSTISVQRNLDLKLEKIHLILTTLY